MRDGLAILVLIEAIGLLSFAVNGMITAYEKRLSDLALFLVAATAALGGGTLRDLLLGAEAQPFFWEAHPFYIVVIFVMSMAYAKLESIRWAIRNQVVVIKEISEVVAFASLASIGTAKAFTILSDNAHEGLWGTAHLILLSALLGSTTSVAGSVMRDITVGKEPSSLKRGAGVLEPLLAGTALIAGLLLWGVGTQPAMLAGFLVIVAIRGVLLWWPKQAIVASHVEETGDVE